VHSFLSRLAGLFRKDRRDHDLARDLRYGLRTLRKNPGFTAVAGLTLALGIGGCGAMYAYIRQLVLSDNPYPDPGSLVVVQEVDPRDAGSNRGVSGRAFLAVKNDSQMFADIGGDRRAGLEAVFRRKARRRGVDRRSRPQALHGRGHHAAGLLARA
jgi:hypothetical protein